MSDWQPIETAPNATVILVWCSKNKETFIGFQYQGNKRWDCWHSDGQIYPTYWMPLPNPPIE